MNDESIKKEEKLTKLNSKFKLTQQYKDKKESEDKKQIEDLMSKQKDLEKLNKEARDQNESTKLTNAEKSKLLKQQQLETERIRKLLA